MQVDYTIHPASMEELAQGMPTLGLGVVIAPPPAAQFLLARNSARTAVWVNTIFLRKCHIGADAVPGGSVDWIGYHIHAFGEWRPVGAAAGHKRQPLCTLDRKILLVLQDLLLVLGGPRHTFHFRDPEGKYFS